MTAASHRSVVWCKVLRHALKVMQFFLYRDVRDICECANLDVAKCVGFVPEDVRSRIGVDIKSDWSVLVTDLTSGSSLSKEHAPGTSGAVVLTCLARTPVTIAPRTPLDPPRYKSTWESIGMSMRAMLSSHVKRKDVVQQLKRLQCVSLYVEYKRFRPHRIIVRHSDTAVKVVPDLRPWHGGFALLAVCAKLRHDETRP